MNATPYLNGTNVSVTIPLAVDGVPVYATGVSYRLLDGADNELIAKTIVSTFVADDPEVTIAVEAINNTIAPGDEVRDVRTIELYVTDGAGEFKIDYSYMIEKEIVLVEGVNSFQSYGRALVHSTVVSKIDGWAAASKYQRINALIEAKRVISELPFRCCNLSALTKTEYQALSKQFRDALSRAQILHANKLLQTNDSEGDIESGIQAKTVGDAKNVYQIAVKYKSKVDKRAMQELASWLSNGIGIAR